MRYALAGLAPVTQFLQLFLASALDMFPSIIILLTFNRVETQFDWGRTTE